MKLLPNSALFGRAIEKEVLELNVEEPTVAKAVAKSTRTTRAKTTQ